MEVSIVGYGRFGQTLDRLLKDDFDLTIFDENPSVFEGVTLAKNTKVARSVAEIYRSPVIFYAVPISEFAGVIKSHHEYFNDDHLLIDVLSVKIHPQQVLTDQLKGLKTQALLTHPMFGPDSSKDGFSDLPIVLDQFKASDKNYTFWKDFFARKGLNIVELTAQKHDQLAANSQGLTHLIGRLLAEYPLKPTEIDTQGAKQLYQIMEQTGRDSWELFLDLQNYNPYAKAMRSKLIQTLVDLSQKIER